MKTQIQYYHMQTLNIATIHPTWKPLVLSALTEIDHQYLHDLETHTNWLPGANAIFNAFSLPLPKTRYILFGESPYPRAESANGYAFWDANVTSLWSETGLSKRVNRATSLRHFIKMLLIADNALSPDDTTQTCIAQIDKSHYVQTIDELFQNMLNQGFLLLNTSLVLSEQHVRRDAKAWYPFIETLLSGLIKENKTIKLLLFGKVAEAINRFVVTSQFPQLIAEHPYNISFMHNQKVIDFFKPLHLLKKSAGIK